MPKSKNKRKLQPKLANSVKKGAMLTQAFDEGYRYGFNGYKPVFFYKRNSMQFKFNDGLTKGKHDRMNQQKL